MIKPTKFLTVKIHKSNINGFDDINTTEDVTQFKKNRDYTLNIFYSI